MGDFVAKDLVILELKFANGVYNVGIRCEGRGVMVYEF